MDSTIRTNERAANTGDRAAAARAIAHRIRLGELPEGAIVTLDASKVEAGWPKAGGWHKWGAAPKKLTGTWKIVPSWSRGVCLHRISKRTGRELKPIAANMESLSEERLRSVLVSVEPPRADEPKAKAIEAAPAGAPIARRFSMCGPCLSEGRVVRETARFYVLEARGRNERISKDRVHVEPCRSCTDHPETQYPYGYTN